MHGPETLEVRPAMPVAQGLAQRGLRRRRRQRGREGGAAAQEGVAVVGVVGGGAVGVEARGSGVDGGVGVWEADEHVVDGVVGHVVDLGVDLVVLVVAGSGKYNGEI